LLPHDRGASKAQDIFQDTVREAAFLGAKGERRQIATGFFVKRAGVVSMSLRTACNRRRGRTKRAKSRHAPEQIEQLEPEQLAIGFLRHPNRSAAFSLSIISMNSTTAK
jgi:hypothetical protein